MSAVRTVRDELFQGGNPPTSTLLVISALAHPDFSAVFVSPRPLLIVHGLNDTCLPPKCAQQIYQWAAEPKELVLYPGTEHGLWECKDELHDLLCRWIPEKLGVA